MTKSHMLESLKAHQEDEEMYREMGEELRAAEIGPLDPNSIFRETPRPLSTTRRRATRRNRIYAGWRTCTSRRGRKRSNRNTTRCSRNGRTLKAKPKTRRRRPLRPPRIRSPPLRERVWQCSHRRDPFQARRCPSIRKWRTSFTMSCITRKQEDRSAPWS